MIDTIVLRINNFKKYPKLYEQYYNPQKNNNSVSQSYVNTQTGEFIENDFTMSAIYHDTNRVIPFAFRSSINLPSSHYSVIVEFNLKSDYIQFSFAIPKYIYGTNLLQFVNIYNQDYDVCFSKFKIFITDFIKENLTEKPLFEDIEIFRIDLCYNQFFNTKEDSLNYLDEQKKLLIKYSRASNNNYRSYDTSLMYITKRYSFKIYHKGTEFKKNDYKELVKNNEYFDYPLQEFLDISDTILRYEMTFRKSYLNYILRYYFFNTHEKLKSPLYTNHPLTKFGEELTNYVEGNMNYNGRFKTGVEDWFRNSKKFCLSSIFDLPPDFSMCYMSDVVTFDKYIFRLLFNKFWEKIKQYQLTEYIDVNNVLNKIRDFNKTITEKNYYLTVQKQKKNEWRLLSAALLTQHIPLLEFKKYMPTTSFKRLKTDLKKIGITEKATKLDFPIPKLDYLDYRLYFSKYHHEI